MYLEQIKMSDKIFKNMSNKTILHVGFDDTDSPKGMCTTFLAFKMVDYLKSQDTDFVDFPKFRTQSISITLKII